MLRFDTYRYLWPARPERVIAPPALIQIQAMGWWAQPKLNGTNCTLYVSPSGETIQRARHGDEAIKNWNPGKHWQAFVDNLPRGHWHVFQSELLHTKGTGRDTLYLYDMLVQNGQYLIGSQYQDRYARLANLCGMWAELYDTAPWREFNPGVWLAGAFVKDFRETFDRLQADTRIEGLVCKKPNAPLALCSRTSSNSGWQVKCRYPKANISF